MLVIACGGRAELGVLANKDSHLGRLEAGCGALDEETCVLVPEVIGMGEQEAGQPSRGGDGPVAFCPALGNVAVEQVAVAGVALLLHLAKLLFYGDGGVGRTAFAQLVAVGVDQGGPVARRLAQGFRCARSA